MSPVILRIVQFQQEFYGNFDKVARVGQTFFVVLQLKIKSEGESCFFIVETLIFKKLNTTLKYNIVAPIKVKTQSSSNH